MRKFSSYAAAALVASLSALSATPSSALVLTAGGSPSSVTINYDLTGLIVGKLTGVELWMGSFGDIFDATDKIGFAMNNGVSDFYGFTVTPGFDTGGFGAADLTLDEGLTGSFTVSADFGSFNLTAINIIYFGKDNSQSGVIRYAEDLRAIDGGASVPLPAPVLLLLGALSGLAFLRRSPAQT